MTNHEKFLGLYNDLDDVLRKRYHNQDRSVSMFVRFVSDLNKTGTRSYILMAKKLNMIRVIRNSLVHELDMNKDNLIEVTDETIEFLENLIKVLEHPKKAKDIGTKIENAFTLRVIDNIKIENLVHLMRNKGFSQVPILGDNNILKGVFSPNVLFEYLSQNPEKHINDLSLIDLKDYTSIGKHFSESYIFISESMFEEDIDDLYTEKLNNNSKPAMIFVTENGKENEPVKNIIVLTDLLNAAEK